MVTRVSQQIYEQNNGVTNYRNWADIIYNVKVYGATGDGVTNDTAAILVAIQAANDAGGGVVYFPAGVYIINQIYITYDNITFMGSGKDVSVLKRANNYSETLIGISGDNFNMLYMTIDGNTPNNTTNPLGEMSINGDYCTIQNCSFRAFRKIGVGINGDNTRIMDSDFYGNNAPNVYDEMGVWFRNATDPIHGLIITRCIFRDHGICAVTGLGYDIIVSNCYFENNHLQDNPVGGGQIQPTTLGGDYTQGSWVVSNNIIVNGGNTGTSGIECNAANIVIANNVIIGNKFNGITLQSGFGSNQVLITGNVIVNNGQTFYGSGIEVGANQNNVSIIGNRIYDNRSGGSKTQLWGILVEGGTSNNIIISGNDLTGNINADGLSLPSTLPTNIQITGNLPKALNVQTTTAISVTLAAGASTTLVSGRPLAVVDVIDLFAFATTSYMIRGTNNATVEIYDPNNYFENSDTGLNNAIYYNGTNYVLKNRSADSRSYKISIRLI